MWWRTPARAPVRLLVRFDVITSSTSVQAFAAQLLEADAGVMVTASLRGCPRKQEIETGRSRIA